MNSRNCFSSLLFLFYPLTSSAHILTDILTHPHADFPDISLTLAEANPSIRQTPSLQYEGQSPLQETPKRCRQQRETEERREVHPACRQNISPEQPRLTPDAQANFQHQRSPEPDPSHLLLRQVEKLFCPCCKAQDSSVGAQFAGISSIIQISQEQVL